MSKKLLFLYITSSVIALFTLVIAGVITKVILGGLNVNFLEQRLSSHFKTEHEIILKSDDYILKYNEDYGVFIDILKTNLILNNETSFSSDQIKIDFDLIDLLYQNKGQLITVSYTHLTLPTKRIV